MPPVHEISVPKISIPQGVSTDHTLDYRINAVRHLLHKYHAPLESNATDFVKAAKLYGLDYRLLVAISLQESSGGRFEGVSRFGVTHNPFGIGGARKMMKFSSHSAAIYYAAKYIATARPYRGHPKTPEGIGCIYDGTVCSNWISKVRGYMNQMVP